ncbi:MAG: D-tyrosyl-tRNA(Tyr) deacylase [Rhodobacteraceae bacterium]|nr:D-tyrosyl-tRNA(Tyr) deacylase [Paracoccaceae bacterium]
MRVLVQRVSEASVAIENEIRSKIGRGVLILLGIENEDNQEDVDWLCAKIAKLRIFPDGEGIMNLSLMDTKGEALVVSQFTLHASTKKGNRPSYIKAARPEVAIPLYEKFVSRLTQVLEKEIETGEFGADMKVRLINDGPVSIWIDSKSKE